MDIKRNLYQNGIFIGCCAGASGVVAGLNGMNVASGAGLGLAGGLVIVGGLALYDNRPDKPKPNKVNNHVVRAFEYQGSNHTQDVANRWTSKDLWGFRPRKETAPAIVRPVELDEWLFGSYTRAGQPFIFSERHLFKFLSSVERHPNAGSNLSRRYHVGRVRSVRADMYDAIKWFIGLTQFTTGVQLIRQGKHQHYGLNEPARRVFVLMTYVEHTERQRGRGAIRMNEALNYRLIAQ